jgi:putative hydrolase of the HAD superfamily
MLTNIGKGGLSTLFVYGFLDQFFDTVVASSDIGYAKPEARAFEITAEKLGVRLDECVFVDDRQPYIEGAAHVGMKTILYTDFESFSAQLNTILSNVG